LLLNDEQTQVVQAVEGVYVVISGPGSGKTASVVERFLGMLMRGINKRDILNLTFTASAAEEMAKRVGILNVESVFRTFHSFALELVKKERQFIPFRLTDTVIPVRGEDYALLFELVKQYPAIPSFKVLQQKISEWKRSNIEPRQAIMESIGEDYYLAQAYEDYEKICRQQGWLDFDSLMREAVALLRNNPEVRQRNQKKYITVDEAQDTDVVQFEFLRLLFSGNIMAVGDENQLVYAWRSAQPGSLTNFETQYPRAKKLYLGQNYRSTGKLVSFFKSILPVDNGLASHMRTDNPEGVEPKYLKFMDSDQEAQYVLTTAKADPENSVIIARTNRQLFAVQRIAADLGIKYKNLGKKDFWEQGEVKALLNFAKDVDQQLPAGQALTQIIEDNNLYYRYRHTGDMNNDPAENLDSVVRLATNKKMNVFEFSTYIRKLTYGRKSRKEKDLMLATVHQFKGREAKHVFLIGAEQGRMPHKDGSLDEERRIFFVACTRAAESLQISWSGSRSIFLDDYVNHVRAHPGE
jgi:DNA helicase II / ATP-dependent DNA helicase PcrA